MTTSPYSLDLRKKVIQYIEKGKKQKEASEVFAVHRNTVSRWWNRYRKEGTFAAKARLGAKRSFHLEELVIFMKKNPDNNLSDVANRFKISTAWSSICLRKLGYSYKKKSSAMWKRVKKKEIDTKNQ